MHAARGKGAMVIVEHPPLAAIAATGQVLVPGCRKLFSAAAVANALNGRFRNDLFAAFRSL